jgi:hypothetical protein
MTGLQLRDDWYQKINLDQFDLDQAGIYEWRIDGIGLYVGKAKRLRSRLRAYPNNVRRMLQGLHWHGNPDRSYRPIHLDLRYGYDNGNLISLSILENCEPEIRNARERYWIGLRKQEEAAGGPRVLNAV